MSIMSWAAPAEVTSSMPSSASGNSPSRQPRGTPRAFASSCWASLRRVNSATAASRRYSARAARRPAADIAPSTWLSVSRPRSPVACSVSAASTGPGRIASADRSRANTSPPSPSGPSIAASSVRSTSAASPRPMVAAGPSISHSSGIRARPASRSAIYDAISASPSQSSSGLGGAASRAPIGGELAASSRAGSPGGGCSPSDPGPGNKASDTTAPCYRLISYTNTLSYATDSWHIERYPFSRSVQWRSCQAGVWVCWRLAGYGADGR